MVEFRSPRTWRNTGIKPTDLNREIRDQIRKLQKEILILQSSSTAGTVTTGTIVPTVNTTVPTGWLVCDGRSLPKASYNDLWLAIGVAYGAATTTHFTIPDFREKFLRGNSAAGTGLISGRGNASGSDSESVTEAYSQNSTVTLQNYADHYHYTFMGHTHNFNATHGWTANTTNHAHNTGSHGHGIGGSTANGNRGNGAAATANVSHGHGTNSGSLGGTNAAGDSFPLTYTENFTGWPSNVNSIQTGAAGSHDHTFSETTSFSHTHSYSTVPSYEGVSYLIKT